MSVPIAGSLLTMLLLLLSCSIVDSVPPESAPVVMYSGHPQPERWILYDLEQPFGPLIASNSTELSVERYVATQCCSGLSNRLRTYRRTTVTVCERIITVAAGCAVSINAIKDFSKWVAGVISDASKQRSCGTFSGSMGGISYRYQANGKNCDTTAEEKTIEGAILHHIKTTDGSNV